MTRWNTEPLNHKFLVVVLFSPVHRALNAKCSTVRTVQRWVLDGSSVPKVLAGAGAHISSEGHFDSARRAATNGNVKEHNRVGHDKLAD
jgi:hypothetical protein